MTELHTIRSASHVSVLHAWEGYGVTVCPSPTADVVDPLSGAGLHAADWDAHLREVLRLGFEPDTDEYGELLVEPLGETQGHELVVLAGDSLSSRWDDAAFMAARAEVLSTALALIGRPPAP